MDELLWAFKNSFIQALFSSIFSLIFGLVLSFGLFQLEKFNSRLTKSFEFLLLLPQFLPSLFTILLALEVIDPFPMGKIGIILVHTILFSGFAAVLLKRVCENSVASFQDLAVVEGASSFLFLKRTLPLMKKAIFAVGISIFIVCFASFSVPFVVGGGKGTTLEILIYEKIRISDDWTSAILLSAIQILFLGFCSLIVRKSSGQQNATNKKSIIFGSRFSLGVMLIFSLGYLALLSIHLLKGLEFVSEGVGFEIFFQVLPTTLLIGFVVGVLTWLLLLLTSFSVFNSKLESALNFLVMPGTAFLGFAFAVLFGFEKISVLIVAFEVLIFTAICRLGWFSAVDRLKEQVHVALTLGASRKIIFRSILLPQLQKEAALYSSIAGIWMLGDFALSRMMLSQDVTLSMLIQSLMSSYRIDAAFGGSAILLASGLLLFVAFNGVGHVLSKKLS